MLLFLIVGHGGHNTVEWWDNNGNNGRIKL